MKNQEQLISCCSQEFFSKQMTQDELFAGVCNVIKIETSRLLFGLLPQVKVLGFEKKDAGNGSE